MSARRGGIVASVLSFCAIGVLGAPSDFTVINNGTTVGASSTGCAALTNTIIDNLFSGNQDVDYGGNYFPYILDWDGSRNYINNPSSAYSNTSPWSIQTGFSEVNGTLPTTFTVGGVVNTYEECADLCYQYDHCSSFVWNDGDPSQPQGSSSLQALVGTCQLQSHCVASQTSAVRSYQQSAIRTTYPTWSAIDVIPGHACYSPGSFVHQHTFVQSEPPTPTQCFEQCNQNAPTTDIMMIDREGICSCYEKATCLAGNSYYFSHLAGSSNAEAKNRNRVLYEFSATSGSPTVSPTGAPTGAPTITAAVPTGAPTITTVAPTGAPVSGAGSQSTGSVVCDSQTTDCNVVSGIDFSFRKGAIVDYNVRPDTVVGGVGYEYVLEYNVEDDFTMQTDFRICEYHTASVVDCSGVQMWLNGTESGSQVIVDVDGRECCHFDTYGVYTRDQLLNARGNLFFLMDGMISDTEKFVIERTTDAVVPVDIAKLFAFRLDAKSLAVVGDNTVISLTIADVDHSTNSDFNHTGCDDIPTTMASINVNGCILPLDSSSNNDYSYLLPSSRYEECSVSKYNSNGNINYDSVVTLPTTVGSCHYFQPGENIQPIKIVIAETTDTDLVFNAMQIGVEVTDIQTERCLPYDAYVLAHSTLVYTVVYTFNGTDVSLTGTPYLNVPMNTMVVRSKTCVGDKCTFELASTMCERIYTDLTETGCVFDRNDGYVLNGLSVEEVGNPYSPTSIIHTIDTLDTDTELVIFPSSDCFTPDYLTFVNVTDSFNFELKAKNLFSGGPTPDWTTPTPFSLDFFSEIVLRLAITDAGAFATSDLQIEKVEFLVKDSGVTLTKLAFDRSDKASLMKFIDTNYFEDAHFCRFYDGTTKTCDPFYDTNTARSNSYVAGTLLGRLDEICQKPVDATNIDFFTLLFTNWLGRINTKSLVIEGKVTATLRDCSSIQSRRLLGSARADDDAVEIKYLETGFDAILRFEGPTEPIGGSSSTSSTESVAETSKNVAVAALVVIMMVVIGLAVCLALLLSKKCILHLRKNGTDNTYYNIQY